MPPLNMTVSRFSTLLCLKRKTNQVTNLLFQHVSNNSRRFHCSLINTCDDKESNVNLKEHHLSKKTTFDNVDYFEMNNVTKSNKNIESNSDVTKMHNELQDSCNIELLERDDFESSNVLENFDEKLPGPFAYCTEDLSDIGPNITATFNFAKFANESHTIQQLVKLGVELYKLEANKKVVEMFLKLDFDKDMKPHIQFLHDYGVRPENLGSFITKNPKIFKENISDLHTRIRYLTAHNFSINMIQIILNKHPPWLSFNVKEIDKRLGYFQNKFNLPGCYVRYLVVKCPKLITYDMKRINNTTFSIKEEMGFNEHQAKSILISTPRVWIRARRHVMETFDYLHNVMKLSHSTICEQSTILLCRKSKLERRHQFLVELKRNQYDPSKPLYVSPMNLCKGDDPEFCENVAKASINIYNDFLKIF